MYDGRMIFSQLMDFIPRYEFRKCVDRYQGNSRVRTYTCWDQFLSMTFAQLTYRESLRDIEACLRAMQDRLYHMGIRGKVSRNTLAVANEKRDWRIYADFAQILINEARQLYADEPFGVDLAETVYALDSTTIDLCLSLFPWARFRKRKGAIKLHTLLDLRGNIPVFIRVSDGKVHDVNILDELIPEPGAIYIMDRGYIDFSRLHTLNQLHAIFVIRAKKNLKYDRIYSQEVDRSTGLICDQIIRITGIRTSEKYPDKLRRIKSFYGNSLNAVKTQIWIAISVYVLVAILKKKLKIERDLYTILQILSITLFEKLPIQQALTRSGYTFQTSPDPNQLELFDL